ncbi:MAG: hypothetical protein KAJ19_20660 [Gammaproteobacteria bacterium]|nr:hypothetical protein [Gammaproteobacteria bacterium]
MTKKTDWPRRMTLEEFSERISGYRLLPHHRLMLRAMREPRPAPIKQRIRVSNFAMAVEGEALIGALDECEQYESFDEFMAREYPSIKKRNTEPEEGNGD